jgi:hypothetical protein
MREILAYGLKQGIKLPRKMNANKYKNIVLEDIISDYQDEIKLLNIIKENCKYNFYFNPF